MRPIQIKGIEILDDENIPPGEIWLLCPMQNGGKVRYMFNLTDHRMTMPGADKCFLVELEDKLLQLESGMQSADERDQSLGRIGLILESIVRFKTGKDPRTLAE